ncbi:MAG: pyridoxal-phosphate dependent enzyme [Thermoleophilia bacterium]|nr:pyridoxal-phosphate dependent enzyme [Thermoleophilia bacterium]
MGLDVTPPALERIEEARRAIAGTALRTPLLRLDPTRRRKNSPDIYLKLENLQPIGSFKIRGAAAVVAATPAKELARGLVTASAGNMAQGVAWLAREHGVSCTVVAPESAPLVKTDAVERLGARVLRVPFADWWRAFEERRYPGVEGVFVHAFDDVRVMAGNGTIALEILEDLPEVDAIVTPWGGGGLTCGVAAAARALQPAVQVFAAEVEGAAPLAASLEVGEPRTIEYRPSFVDGIGSPTVFPQMLARAQDLVAGGLVVSVDAVADALLLMAERNHVIAEGAGACPVACALAGGAGEGTVVCVVSGGSISLEEVAALMSRPGEAARRGRPA